MKKIFVILRNTVIAALIFSFLISAVGAVALYDPAQEGIVSSYYQIEQGVIRGIAPGTTGEKLRKVCLPADVSVPSGALATGMKATSGKSALTVVVTGDLNGDAKVSITDLLMIKSFLLGQKLSAVASVAGDVNYDSKVTITDFLRIKSNLLGMEGISAGWTAGATSRIPFMLLKPGETAAWSSLAANSAKMVAFQSETELPVVNPLSDDTQAPTQESTEATDPEQEPTEPTPPPESVIYHESANAAIAAVDTAGVITAGQQEGTTFVYVKNGLGVVLDRVMITVLKEPLSVVLGQTEHRLITGRTLTLSAQVNHPVPVKVSWSSSDSAVASVDASGKVTAHKVGKAVITASLPNGSSAKATITVASPITAVKTERTLYKVKPGASKKIPLQMQPAGEEEVFLWTSSNPAVAKVSEDGTVTGVKNGTVTVTATGKYSGLKASCQVKICNVKQVAMTFDDGPSGQTGKLLDYLKQNDIRVTFFMVGNRMSSYADTLKREAAEGHELGFHSYAHQQQTGLSSAQIKSDFDKSNQYLKKLTGREFTVWRTPGGGYNDRVLQALPLPHIMWSVDTLDWKNRNAASVKNAILNNAKDGSIILMHDLYATTVDGAISAMQQMQAGDYEFVTVTELLSRNGTPPKASTTYFRGP